jgi:replicative DNA helicase
VKIAKHRNGSLDTIKLRGLLHIQKFIEDEPGGGSDFNPNMGGGNWKPVQGGGDDSARMYIQKGSKMNDGAFDDEAPF